MLSYLPENVYEGIKGNKDYAILVDEYSGKIFGKDDISYIQSLLDYVSENPLIIDLQKKLYEIVEPKYKKILDIFFTDDFKYNEEDYKDDLPEIKLMAIYYNNGGETILSEEFNQQVEKYLSIYKECRETDLSSFVHIVAYSYYMFREIYKLNNNDSNQDDLYKFLDYEESSFNYLKDILKDCNDSVKNIMYHKRIQMLTYFYENSVQFFMVDEKIIKDIEEKLDNKDFKYNDFNWFKILFYQLVFQRYIDKVDIESALLYFSKLYNLVIYSIQNKQYSMKALNHFNKAFLDNYVYYLKVFYNMINICLPKLKNYFIKELTKLNIKDVNFITDRLSNEDKIKIYKLINTDTPYSISWIKNNKEKIKLLNDYFQI